jgi:heme/copper-type cytochrome/quinol oxidase subunit 2
MKRIALLLFMFFTHFSYAQCAMCRAVVESGSPSEAEGLNSGILYLMIFPYILIGTLFFFIIKYRISKKKNKEI